jgi:hypothetical protein
MIPFTSLLIIRVLLSQPHKYRLSTIYNLVNSTKIDNRQKNPLLKIDFLTAFSKQLKLPNLA